MTVSLLMFLQGQDVLRYVNSERMNASTLPNLTGTIILAELSNSLAIAVTSDIWCVESVNLVL